MSTHAVPERVRLRRRPARGHHDRATIDAILDEAMLAHVGWIDGDGPAVVPTTFARDGDHLLLHGAPAARWLRPGLALCVSVTLLDGLVLARSALHHSANYRSVVLYGEGELVADAADKRRALDVIVEHLLPGRCGHTRPPSPQEMAATAVLRVPIAAASAKVRTGGPVDDSDDLHLPHWAGVLPLRLVAGAPVGDTPGVEVPAHVRRWRREPLTVR